MKSLLTVIVSSFAAAVLLAEGVLAQQVPLLKQGMPYVKARPILINAGWQAVARTPQQRQRDLTGGEQYIVQELHFNEVIGCSGTGLGLCRFEFAAADGRKLIVTTSSNAKRYGGPILYRWWIEGKE